MDGIVNTTSIAIMSLRFFHGSNSGEGGCLSASGYIDLLISDSAFLWCAGSYGGAIMTRNGVSFTMIRTKLSHNVARFQAGAIYLNRKEHVVHLK